MAFSINFVKTFCRPGHRHGWRGAAGISGESQLLASLWARTLTTWTTRLDGSGQHRSIERGACCLDWRRSVDRERRRLQDHHTDAGAWADLRTEREPNVTLGGLSVSRHRSARYVFRERVERCRRRPSQGFPATMASKTSIKLAGSGTTVIGPFGSCS